MSGVSELTSKTSDITGSESRAPESPSYDPEKRLDVRVDKPDVPERGDKTEAEGNPIGEEQIREKIDSNGYIYRYDELGRTISAEGFLKTKDHEDRYPLNPSLHEVASGDQKDGDERGHLIADRFEGRPETDNLVAQSHEANMAFGRIEDRCAKAQEEGKRVMYKVEAQYEGESKRPTEFEVTYTIDGEEKHTIISNEPSKG